MSHSHVLVKVYAHVWPVHQQLYTVWQELLPQSSVMDAEEMLCYEGDMLKLSYEGIYFPLDDFLESLHPFLHKESQGKLDYIDLEAWKLTRHKIQGKELVVSSASLNNVLDYSGH